MSDSDPSFAALGSDDSDAASGSDSDADFAADAAAADAGSEDDEVLPVVLSQAELKARNVRAMLSGSLTTSRASAVAGLRCQDVAAVLAAPFRAPFKGASDRPAGPSAELQRRLATRRRFVPWVVCCTF